TEFITLTRAIDKKWIHPEGFSPFDASPINWVGDQKHTWGSSGEDNMGAGNDDLVRETDEGIELAIESILQSAELGYSLVGSDIAGFSGGEIPANLYIRWAQFSTFCGLFLNGGHGERRLWKRSQEELEVIRKFTWLHKELIPYMYHYVVMAHSGEKLLQKAMDKGRYQYMFGDDFLIAPICEDSKIREVVLPEGKWRYFFDDKKVIAGGTYKREYPLDEFPVYLKEGAIIPMDIQRNYMQMGDSTSAGFTTILVYPEDKNKFHYYHTDLIGETVISYEEKENSLLLKLEGTKIPHILRIHSTSSPTDVKLDGQIISEGKWQFDEEKLKLIIRIQTYKEGNYEIQF
ncbi:MAG: TIM-barrel domain-containing protein, partial [Bacteroidota bacterium]